jgi:stage III sporulation protein AH
MFRILVFRRRLLLCLLAVLLLVVVGTAGLLLVGREKTKDMNAGATERTAPAAPATPALTPGERESVTTAPADSFFVDFRLEREANRDRRMELLREIAAAPVTGAEVRKEAQEKIMSLSREAELEMRAENILRAKGFSDAVVALQEEGATVVVLGRISPDDMMTVVTLVYRSLGMPQENVAVIERN